MLLVCGDMGGSFHRMGQGAFREGRRGRGWDGSGRLGGVCGELWGRRLGSRGRMSEGRGRVG